MELQLNSLKQFVEDDFELVVMDDSEDNIKSLLSTNRARDEIKNEASRLGLRYIQVPQNVHANVSDGGLVPNGLPANHPTERHRAHLHWIFKNHRNLGFDKYDTFVLIESDMFVKKPLNVSSYMENYDLMGPGRKNVRITKKEGPDQLWPDELKDVAEVTFSFFPMYMLFVNMKTVHNLDILNIGGFAGTDTGGQTGLFIRNNPNYKCCFMDIGSNKNYQIDFFSKESASDEDAEFVHYRAGSNWDHQSIGYYSEKLNRLLKHFVPSLTFALPEPTQDLSSRDKEHTFVKGK